MCGSISLDTISKAGQFKKRKELNLFLDYLFLKYCHSNTGSLKLWNKLQMAKNIFNFHFKKS